MALPLKDISFDVNMSYSEVLVVHTILLKALRLKKYERNRSIISDFIKRLEDLFYYQKM